MPEYEVNSNAALSPGHKATIGSYSLTWSGGPFSAVGGFEQHKGFRAAASATLPQDAKDTGLVLGGRWNYGAGLLGAGVERLKYGNVAAAAAENNFTLTNWVINGTFNVGPSGTVSAGYSKTAGAKSCGAGLTAAANTCGDPTKASNFSLAYDHRLSKRTAVYAVAGRINNGAGSTYYYIAGPASNNNGGDTGGVAAGTDITTYAVGVKHTF